MKRLYGLFLSATNPRDNYSSKRITLLLSLFYFFVFSFINSFVTKAVIYNSGSGDIEKLKLLLAFERDIMQYNFWIIISSLGLITAVDLGYAVVEKAKQSTEQQTQFDNQRIEKDTIIPTNLEQPITISNDNTGEQHKD